MINTRLFKLRGHSIVYVGRMKAFFKDSMRLKKSRGALLCGDPPGLEKVDCHVGPTALLAMTMFYKIRIFIFKKELFFFIFITIYCYTV